MNEEKIIPGIILFVIIIGAGTFFGVIFSTIMPVEDNVLIDGNDIVSYNIINADEIEIVMKDDIIYNIKLGYNDDIVDFTVNSDIHIELEREDTRLFWWDFIIHSEPVYPDEYRIGRIIKLPDVVDNNNDI